MSLLVCFMHSESQKWVSSVLRALKWRVIVSIAIACGLWAAGNAAAQMTTRVSVDSTGAEGNDDSGHQSLHCSVSSDSRYVAFFSYASNLVAGDNNDLADVFVHDRQTGQTTRVSVDSGGGEGNGVSSEPSISSDGRYVAFHSSASNLVAGDNNDFTDVFVHDRQTGQTTRVSVDSGGGEGNGMSTYPSISSDGRYVAFHSNASNLVAGDNNNEDDVFIHDRQTGLTTRVSVDSRGAEGNGSSTFPAVSSDGRYVAFESLANNLVPGDNNSSYDVFVHHLQTGQTTRISVDSGGAEGNDWSFLPSISSDGRYVAFYSYASNLVPGDNNAGYDVFVHDRQTGQTTRVSVDSGGVEGNDWSVLPSISSDGRYVAFESLANNLVPGDINAARDVFVHDRQTGQTTRVSVVSGGVEGNDLSMRPSISSDGRYVAFHSKASNLVAGDNNQSWDVFVHGPLFAQQTGHVVTAPTVTEWGMILFSVVAGMGAVYTLRHRRAGL